MRKVLFAVAGLAVILLVVSSAQAISKGPGGRIYSAGRNVAGNAIILQSFTIDENWDNTSLFYTDHGEIRDVNPYGYKKNSGSSPEIQVGAGTGYGKIVVGASYDNDPASRFSSYETMDVLRVTPSDSGHSVEVLGSGKGAATGGTDWSHRLDKSTDRGQFAIPDPAGAFTGKRVGGNAGRI